jgi:hypothetical protein
MQHLISDSERLRTWAADHEAALSRDSLPSDDCAQSMAAQTVAISSYPGTANVFYGVQALVVTGTETEGSAATTTGSGAKFLAYNLGTHVPPQGTQVLIQRVNWRWVFRYDG